MPGERKRNLLRAVANAFDVTAHSLAGRGQVKHIARARLAAYVIARDALSLSYPEIGRMLGRDHSTIIYGVSRARCLLLSDSDFAARLTRASMEVRCGKA